MSPTARLTHGPPAADAPPVDIGPSGWAIHSVWLVFFALCGASMGQPAVTPWAEPPRLPVPPAGQHYLLEAPLTPALVVVGLALAGGGSLFGAGRAKAGVGVGVGGVLVSVGMVVLAGLVETGREKVIARSLELARAVGGGDGSAVGETLAPTVYLKMGPTGSATGTDDRDLVVRAARMFPGQVLLEAYAVPGGHAVADTPTSARTRLRVRTGGGMGPSLSWWQLDWRLDPDGEWRVYTIELLLFNGETPRAGFSDEARRAVR